MDYKDTILKTTRLGMFVYHPTLEDQAEESFKAGMEECAKTHFKPDWEIKAKDLKDATEEARIAGIKEVVDFITKEISIQTTDNVIYISGLIAGQKWQSKLKEWGIK